MIRNYIEFKYDEDGLLTAKVSQDGKYRYIRNIDNIFKLIDIVEKYGYTVDREMRIVKDARQIINEYNKERAKSRKKNKKKLQIHSEISEGMTVKRNNKFAGRKIAAIALASIIAFTTGSLISKSKEDDNSNEVVKGKYVISEEYNPNNVYEYVEEYEYPDPTTEISDMLSEKAFHFSYENRTDSENIDTVNQYNEIFQKYANMYGLDARLLKAIACQESGGDHYGNIGNGPAEGIMQIEKSVHIGETVSAYNFETQKNDYFEINEENLQDIDFNIRVAAIDLRNAIEAFNYNIPQATQAYNFGIGGMNQTLAICSRNIGESQVNLENNPTNSAWLNYREPLNMGDPNYVEHVFSYIPNNTRLTVLDRDGVEHSVSIANDYVNKNVK